VNKLFLAIALTALTGCATCKQYPTACAAIALVAAGSIALSASHSDHRSSPTPDYTIKPIDCTNGSCK
jgi:hypothetical protein